jgi:hypothetical protein
MVMALSSELIDDHALAKAKKSTISIQVRKGEKGREEIPHLLSKEFKLGFC